MNRLTVATICAFAALATTAANAWDPKDIEERHQKAQEAKATMLEKDPKMQRFFDSAVAYVIIPTVGKGGIGIGGARGKGLLYEGGNITAEVQASAVAVTARASADANYSGGVAIFTQAKGGLMYEASVGGQKFKVEMKD